MSARPHFRSAFPFSGGPVTPEAILEFHRATFGDARMVEGEEGAETPVFKDPETGEEYAFPEKTPTAEMTDAQRTEYWRHKAQKHEKAAKARADYDTVKAERDRLAAEGKTDAEKAAEAAVKAAAETARTEAEAAARSKYAVQLVTAEFKAALAGKRESKDIQTIVDGLDTTKFLTDAGEVDTDKVANYAAGLAPVGKTWPDTGAGKRGKNATQKGVSAGAEMFAASRGKTTT